MTKRTKTKNKAVKTLPFKGVYVGIPIHYNPTANFSISCMMLQRKAGGATWKFHVGDSHPDRARNVIARLFLESNCDRLLFLDADLKFDAEEIVRLCSHDVDIACGFYPLKKPGPAVWVGNALDDTPNDKGLIRMREAGTGCLVIHRRVFEAMRTAYPEISYHADPKGEYEEWDFFRSGVYYDPMAKRRRWLSEDWAFCRMARECGFEIYGDKSVACYHEGSCLYPTEQSDE